MALEVKISGITYIGSNTYQIRQQGGAISSTQIDVRIDGNPMPKSLQSVDLIINSIPVFAGIINQVAGPERNTGFEARTATLTIQSLEVIFSWRLVNHNFYNKYVHEIVQWIFDNLIAPEGITLGEISTTTVQISKYKKSGDKVASVLDDLAKRLEGCSYYISADKKFYFLQRTDFAEVDAPEHITAVKLTEGYGDLRTVQTVKGSSSTIEGTAENTALQAELSGLNGTSGCIEAQESDSDLHSDAATAEKAQSLLDQYSEREKTLTLTCHDLAKSALFKAWKFEAGLFPSEDLYPSEDLSPSDAIFPADLAGTFVVTERTISHFGPHDYSIALTLKNRNFFARYGYSLKNAQQTAAASVASIADMASDGKLTPIEKISARARWNVIAAEKDTYDDQATDYGLATQQAAYDTAFQGLADYLNGGASWVSGYPLWLSAEELSVTEDIDGDVFEGYWRAYDDTKVALAAAITAAAQVAAVAASLAALPGYRGRIAFASLSGASGIENDIILAYDSNIANCGIYKRISGTWTRQATPSTSMISSAWFDILWAIANSFPATGTASEKVQAYMGTGVNYFETLAANAAFIDKLFTNYLKIGGALYGGDRYNADGSDKNTSAKGIWIGADGTVKAREIHLESSNIETKDIWAVDGGSYQLGRSDAPYTAVYAFARGFHPAIAFPGFNGISQGKTGSFTFAQWYSWINDVFTQTGAGSNYYPYLTLLGAVRITTYNMGELDDAYDFHVAVAYKMSGKYRLYGFKPGAGYVYLDVLSSETTNTMNGILTF